MALVCSYSMSGTGDSNAIVFCIDDQKTIDFRFKNLELKEFSELKDNRIGRLLPPYITLIQQRYALYLQRQGLPRIPEEAVKENNESSAIINEEGSEQKRIETPKKKRPIIKMILLLSVVFILLICISLFSTHI